MSSEEELRFRKHGTSYCRDTRISHTMASMPPGAGCVEETRVMKPHTNGFILKFIEYSPLSELFTDKSDGCCRAYAYL